jgi:hypothetical protein
MADELATSFIEALLSLELGARDQDGSNRFSLKGLTVSPNRTSAVEIGIRSFEAAALQFQSGPLVLEVGQLALHQVLAKVRVDRGRPRLHSLDAAYAEVSGVTVQGPLIFSREPQRDFDASHDHGNLPASGNTAAGETAARAWCLGPLAGADGKIRAEIVDAHLLFDADVTVPIRHGQIDFNEVTVEHVGPDSRMGVSPIGLYVDAPNGRSYVYQFSSAPLAGVEFERRGALPGPWGTDRGNMRLQSFIEGLLRQGRGGPGSGFTEQARLLFDRTALSGDVQLSDERFAAPGVEGEMLASGDGRNAIRFKSQAVGRGLSVEIASLSVGHAVMKARDTRVTCDEITGALNLHVLVKGAQLRFAFSVANMKMSRLRLHSPRADGV